MYLLVPAFRPTHRLPALVRAVRAAEPALDVLVVDDGSGPAFADVFEAARDAGAEVVTTAVNHGKGCALKTGFATIAERAPGAAVVTADADGQHAPEDIRRVAHRLDEGDADIVLGARAFGRGTPLRSRIGNAVACVLVRAVGRVRASDTQTGLRGFDPALLDWLVGVPGERFEYELRVLLEAGRRGLRTAEVPIETIYLDENAGSHFRPLTDSVRVLAPLLAYLGSSLAGFVVDVVLLELVMSATASLALAVVAARLVSGSVNFVLNRRLVFRDARTPLGRAIGGYVALATVLLAANWLLLTWLTGLGIALLLAKVLTEAMLLVAGFAVQRFGIFFRAPTTRIHTHADRGRFRTNGEDRGNTHPRARGPGARSPAGSTRTSLTPRRTIPDPPTTRRKQPSVNTLLLLGADLVAIAVLTYGLFLHRHHRRDLAGAFVGVNIGVFAVAAVLGSTDVGLGVGLGLFGVLSIIRLRSSEISQREVAYYFAALALGLVAGLTTSAPLVQLALMALIVVASYVADHPALSKRSRHQVLVLDEAITDEDVLRSRVEQLLGARVRQFTVLQTDFVTDTTRVDVRVQLPRRDEPAPDGTEKVKAPGAARRESSSARDEGMRMPQPTRVRP